MFPPRSLNNALIELLHGPPEGALLLLHCVLCGAQWKRALCTEQFAHLSHLLCARDACAPSMGRAGRARAPVFAEMKILHRAGRGRKQNLALLSLCV